MRARRAIRQAVILTVTCVAILVGVQTPAQAHDRYTHISTAGHYYGHVEIRNSHQKIIVCDDDPDGVGVYAEFYVSHSGSDDQYRTLSDSNGSASPCASWTASGSDRIIGYIGWARNGVNSGWNWNP